MVFKLLVICFSSIFQVGGKGWGSTNIPTYFSPHRKAVKVSCLPAPPEYKCRIVGHFEHLEQVLQGTLTAFPMSTLVCLSCPSQEWELSHPAADSSASHRSVAKAKQEQRPGTTSSRDKTDFWGEKPWTLQISSDVDASVSLKGNTWRAASAGQSSQPQWQAQASLCPKDGVTVTEDKATLFGRRKVTSRNQSPPFHILVPRLSNVEKGGVRWTKGRSTR
jgi:hypothetical protein